MGEPLLNVSPEGVGLSAAVEAAITARGGRIEDSSPEEMNALWDEAKRNGH